MDKLETYTEEERELYTIEDFNSMIDETHEEIKIMGIRFSPSRILEEADPTAHRVYFNDYQEYKTIYTCEECQTEHEDEDEAAECCHVECEECDQWHKTDEEAETCCNPGQE